MDYAVTLGSQIALNEMGAGYDFIFIGQYLRMGTFFSVTKLLRLSDSVLKWTPPSALAFCVHNECFEGWTLKQLRAYGLPLSSTHDK